METILFVFTMLGFSWTVGGAPLDTTQLDQRTQTFTVVVNGSVADTTPLFGPVRESEWASTWRPHFLHPSEGPQKEGAVFTAISGDGRERIWLLTGFDPNAGQIDYVFISPGFTAAELKIRVAPDSSGKCKVSVTYRYSALTPQGNQEVVRVNSDWAEEHRLHWQHSLDTLAGTHAGHE
jgi:hypothetical protein